MAYINVEQLQSPVEGADICMRPKDNGFGWHFGTGLSNGLVKDTMPETGKRITTWEDFCAGKQGLIFRPDRGPTEKGVIEARAVSNLGAGYDGLTDNCEHDMNFCQTGVPVSPSIEAVKTSALWMGGGLLALKVIELLGNGDDRRKRVARASKRR